MISDRLFFLLQKTFTERFPIVTSRARPRYCASLQPARPGLDRHPRVPCACVVVVGNVVVLDFFQSGSFAPFHGKDERVALPQAGQVYAGPCFSCFQAHGQTPRSLFNIHGICFTVTYVSTYQRENLRLELFYS